MWNVLEVLNTKAPTTLLRSVSLQTEDSTPDAALLLERAPSDDRGWNKNSAAADAVPLSAGLLERKTSSIRSPPVMNLHTKMSSGASGLSNHLWGRDSTWGVIDVDAALARKAGSLRGGLVEKQQEKSSNENDDNTSMKGERIQAGRVRKSKEVAGRKLGGRGVDVKEPRRHNTATCAQEQRDSACDDLRCDKDREVQKGVLHPVLSELRMGLGRRARDERKLAVLALYRGMPEKAQCHVYGKVNEKRRLKTKGSSAVKVDGVNEQEKNQKKDSILT
eukprot:CAMPEP_0185846724 /NCGR_PEP_ID=MMETSP1354-20130828/2269_1 /TAXON_ID=708628 /ORGANISM="Erythrolobus madagascarensis, Strain CCMP3276" /LENGTH=276 /DNA_ID=CAMNT_0028546921 /DNA_START=78 /DNA_END=911 /DNA_ORIENTATION=+